MLRFLNYLQPIFILIGVIWGYFTRKTQDENKNLNREKEILTENLKHERELNKFIQNLRSKPISDKRRELSALYPKRK